jgi:NAD(P)-dependent dehydrogenase (short-subunit alcohol dehydrogenase family)
LLFARKGWQVIATMRDPSKESELQSVPGVSLLGLDVTQPAQIAQAAKKALEIGPVDVLFNNAGYGLAGPFEAATDAQLTQEIHTNLLGVMRVTQAFLPAMRERGSGCIVTTTSIGGLVTFPFNCVYHATKWGLEGWSESLAFELARYGIKVKTVAPGQISTDFATRSLVLTQHVAYAEDISKTMKTFMDPKRREKGSSAEQIADVVYEAATDNKDQVTYVAGADAKETYAQRLAVGVEKFRRAIGALFLG